MTSAVLAPIEPSAMDPTAPSAGPPPRKRRRRTAGGGATDDCFACRNRGVKCDRKRPYCSQCIEIGKECSGYKTTLTWGVGVASRGKLRGLSCPVANKNVDGSDVSAVEIESRKSKSSTSKNKKEEAPASGEEPNGTTVGKAGNAPKTGEISVQTYSSSSGAEGIQQVQNRWSISGFPETSHSRQNEPVRHLSLDQASLQNAQTAFSAQYDGMNMPSSARSVTSYAETEFHSPLEYSHTPASLTFPEQLPQAMSNPFQEHPNASSSMPALDVNSTRVGSYAPGLDSSIDSAQSQPTFMDNGTMSSNQAELNSYTDILFNRNQSLLDPVVDAQLGYGPFDSVAIQGQEEDLDESRKDMSLIDTRFSSPFFQMPPRLQSLMDYYDRNICPYLVTFDGPENPYRKHVLQLALNNEGLQNALSALATNNLRMRQKQNRQLGFVEEITDAFDGGSSKDLNEPTPEETCYKQMSIEQLNMQLTDIRAAQDDSVLATLLILCLFHVCDSGFSKFKTQLAGVQKLLSLRNPHNSSDFTRWVEMFFLWFDVMTSTVNDREMQIKGESLAMLDFSANLGAMEQFSGCDGRLFKLIARLGRLNLLAQGRPVRTHGAGRQTPLSMPLQGGKMRPTKRKRASAKMRANKPLTPSDYEFIDGNGWGTPIISSDEDADGSVDEDGVSPDGRTDFWTEWNDIRNRLMSWQMDMSNITSPGPQDAPTNLAEFGAGQRDMAHINECFRYAALLYTERLGHPLLPSSHDQFQTLVSQALYHITALPITSCVNKFLLWPLFIAGTECVDEGHRNIIRSRCRDLTDESGFFNNISSLWLLEKVWQEVGSNVRGSEAEEVKARRRDSEASRSGRYGQAFRWRKAMDRVDGEYIVI